MSTEATISKYRKGLKVRIAVIGNSVGCGYNAANSAAIDAMTISNLKLTDPGRVSSANTGAWVTRLRVWLQTKNAGSQVYNLSGNGWDSNDHVGVKTSLSSVIGATASVPQIKALAEPIDVVLLALQINDANHTLTVATFEANTRAMITALLAAKIGVVMVLENSATLTGYQAMLDKASALATEYGLQVLNFNNLWAPATGSAFMSDALHPNDSGHALMGATAIRWFDREAVGQAEPLRIYNGAVKFAVVQGGPFQLKYAGANYGFATALTGYYPTRLKYQGQTVRLVSI